MAKGKKRKKDHLFKAAFVLAVCRLVGWCGDGRGISEGVGYLVLSLRL